jgi:hypothetical protein
MRGLYNLLRVDVTKNLENLSLEPENLVIRMGVARILSSPSFLYRVETDPANLEAGTPHPVTDLELASRLSFFIWSSIPDDELLDIAIAGRLREPGVRDAQPPRLLTDSRSHAIDDHSLRQSLRPRNLESRAVPDILMFPHFDDNLLQALPT